MSELYEDEAWLRKKYIYEKKDISSVAEEAGCSRSTVCRWLSKHEIDTRDKGVDRNIDWASLNDKRKMKRWYVEDGLSLKEIGNRCNCSQNTVSKTLKEKGIEVRDRGGPRGERNGNFKHGREVLKYGKKWEETREKIIQRDGEKCRLCFLHRSRSKSKFSTDLNVHHIVPRKDFINGQGENDFVKADRDSNLISLCPPCHQMVEGKIDNSVAEEFHSKAVGRRERFRKKSDNSEMIRI